jgi:Cu(I)/Ag(I) efflux system membrane fusion protein
MTQNLGVRTAPAERRTFWRRIDTVGYVEYDRDKLRHVYPSAEGSVVGLTVRSEGERVEQGQFLFELQSPMLSKRFGDVYAEQGGVIADLRMIEGTWALPTEIVMTIGDLSSVWVLADVFEGQADWVKQGQSAEVRLPSLPDRVWKGIVEYIYPNLDPETRTLKVRMRFDNPDEVLKPNMLTEVTIFGGPKRDVLAVPRAALIETGKQQRLVVDRGDGRFQPREVTAGMERGDWVEIAAGLEENERVVVSGQFMIDSESNLQASLSHLEGSEDHEEQEQRQ